MERREEMRERKRTERDGRKEQRQTREKEKERESESGQRKERDGSHFPPVEIKHFTMSCQIWIKRKLAEEKHLIKINVARFC